MTGISANADCGAAKIGTAISALWAKMEADPNCIGRNMRMFHAHKADLEYEPAKSLTGALVKLLMVKDTVENVFNDGVGPRYEQEASINMLLDDVIRFIEVQSGSTVKSLSLDMFYEPTPAH
ncbi:hypothetical protein FNL55_13455 [Tardiphaga sp. vice352]|uniref:hypothetical protein n=1 Tax=Tardiphaga sp. vice352 TaxID=2592816 RepID=UPI001164B76F|nr:hypothetical protein [Tardiphaga sp. vice352]QDM32235.1 hypothetical protein FNL55_13455 [Tardiphaga sp. vice352]